MRFVVVACMLAACGDAAMHAEPDAASDLDAPPGCTRPALAAPWLAQTLDSALTTLAAAPRATTVQRATARAYLIDAFAGVGITASEVAFPSGANVVATLPATVADPGKRVLVGAHFDTVQGSPGANDNATGTAVVLALARYLVETPCRTAPVELVLFDLEETGLFGSRAYAMAHAAADYRAVHTVDQVGWDGDGDRVFELELPTATLEAEYRAAAAIVGVPVSRVITEGTDHEAFRDRNYAAVGLTEEFAGDDTTPHRHQPTDTASTVDRTYLGLAAQLTAQVILEEVAP